MPVVIPRLIVEIFQHVNFRGRMGYVLEPVPHTGRIGFPGQYFFSTCF